KAHKKEGKAPMKKKISEKQTRNSVESSEEGSPSKVKSPYPGPCRQLRKTGLPSPEKFAIGSHFSISSPPSSSSSPLSGRRSKNANSCLSTMTTPRPSALEFQNTGRFSSNSQSSRTVSSPQFGRGVQDSSHSGRKNRNTSPSRMLLNPSGSSLSHSGGKSRRPSNSPSAFKGKSLSLIHSGRKSSLVSPSTSSNFSRSPSSSLQFDSRGRSRSKHTSKSGKSPNSTQAGSLLLKGKVSRKTSKRVLIFQTDDNALITESLPTLPIDRNISSPKKPNKSPLGSRKSLESTNKFSERTKKTPGKTRKSGSEKYKGKSKEPSASKHRQLQLSLKSRTANKEKIKANSISPIIPDQNTANKLCFSLESSLQKSKSEKYRQQGQLKRKSTSTLQTVLLSPHTRSKRYILSAGSLKSPVKMSPRKVTHSNSGSFRIKMSAQDANVIGFKDNEPEDNAHQVRDFNCENFQALSFQKLSTEQIAKTTQRKCRSTTNIQCLSAPTSSVIAQVPRSAWKWKNRNVRTLLFINDSITSKKMTSASRNSSVICTPDGSFAEYSSSLDDSVGSFSRSGANFLSSAAVQDTAENKFDSVPSKRAKKSYSKGTINVSNWTGAVGKSELNSSPDLQTPSPRSKRNHYKWTSKKQYKGIKKDVTRPEMMDMELEDVTFSSLTNVDKNDIFQEHPQETVNTTENKDTTGHVPQIKSIKVTKELKKKRCTRQETNLMSSNVGHSGSLLHPLRKHKGTVVRSGGKDENSELSHEQKDSANNPSEPESIKDEFFLKTVDEGTRNANIACQRGLKRKRKRSLEEMGQFTLNKWLKEGKVGLPNCRQKQENGMKVLQDQDPCDIMPKAIDLVLKWRGKTFIVQKNSLVKAKEVQGTWIQTKKAHLTNTVSSENFFKSRATNIDKSIADVLSSGKAIGRQDSIQISKAIKDMDDIGLSNSNDGMSNLSILADLSHDFRVTRQMVNSSEFRKAGSKQPSLKWKIDGQEDGVVDGDAKTEVDKNIEKTAAKYVEVAQTKKELAQTSTRHKVDDDKKNIQNTEKEDGNMDDDTRKLSNSENETSYMEVIDYDEFLKMCNSDSEEKHLEDTLSASSVPEKEQVLLTKELNQSVDYFDFSGKEVHVIDQEKTSMTYIPGNHDKHQDTDMKNINSKEDKISVSDKGVMLEYFTLNEEKVVTLVCTPHKPISC
ncbi:hypothetical protein ACJMK2_037272, partial [Sinanodonta woodiana]